MAQVLRMKNGDRIRLTDGCGLMASAEITDNHKSHCTVKIIDVMKVPERPRRLTMAVSLLKQPARFEWFLEKATEVGVNEIIPLICARTEKQQFKEERWKGILLSAMLQSKQCRLPQLHAPSDYSEVIQKCKEHNKLIAYCGDEFPKKELSSIQGEDIIMLIGPEGDFTSEEITLALSHGFQSVSLGENRLRTETAAIYSCILLNQ